MIRTSGQDLQSAEGEGQLCQVQNPSIERFQTLVIMLPLWTKKSNRSHSFTKPRTSDNNLIASYSTVFSRMSTAQEIVHLFEKQLGEGSQQPAE